jgi:hypothetical protein
LLLVVLVGWVRQGDLEEPDFGAEVGFYARDELGNYGLDGEEIGVLLGGGCGGTRAVLGAWWMEQKWDGSRGRSVATAHEGFVGFGTFYSSD